MKISSSVEVKSIKFVLALVIIVLAQFANAADGRIYLSAEKHNVLILIGYTDKVEFANPNLLSHQYNFLLGDSMNLNVESLLSQAVNSAGISKGLYKVYQSPSSKKDFYIINSNELCPSDRMGDDDYIKRPHFSSLCDVQKNKINFIKHVLKTDLKHFDEFIYIGHARQGMGLGIGPFDRESTYNVSLAGMNLNHEGFEQNQITESAADWVGSRLKKIIFLSCDSNMYYRSVVESLGFSFIGTDDKIKASLKEEQDETFRLFKNYLLQNHQPVYNEVISSKSEVITQSFPPESTNSQDSSDLPDEHEE